MNRLVLSIMLLPAICSSANAKSVTLKGAAADHFIAKHFPDASIPGPVEGAFTDGPRKGYARCDVPAMGARSDGAVSTCTLRY